MGSVMYFGTDHGVVTLKNHNGQGNQWELAAQGLRDWSVPEVMVAAGAPDRVFAATRGDGVWLSVDAGRSWTKPSYGQRGPGKVRCLAVDPRDPQTVYAGTEPIDLFVSHDGCRTWERLESFRRMPSIGGVGYPVPFIEPHVRDIAIDPLDSRTITVALQVGHMLRTTDGGATWSLLNRDVDADVHTIVIDPRQPARMFVATGGEECRTGRVQGRALYRSLDGGASWQPTALEFAQEYSVPLLMDPTMPNTLYSAVANSNPGDWNRPTGAESAVIRTTDGGVSWHQLRKGLEDTSRDFPMAMVIDSERTGALYLGLRGGGVYVSHDRGDTWAALGLRVDAIQDMKLAHT